MQQQNQVVQEFIDDHELARRLGIARTTIQHWRLQAKGPAFVRVGRLIRYDVRDVERWIEAQKVGAA